MDALRAAVSMVNSGRLSFKKLKSHVNNLLVDRFIVEACQQRFSRLFADLRAVEFDRGQGRDRMGGEGLIAESDYGNLIGD